MIEIITDHIAKEIKNYLGVVVSPDDAEKVYAGSLFDLNGGINPDSQEKLIISLVNIEQDKTYHSVNIYKKKEGGKNEFVQPEVKINLYFLFAANFSKNETALKFLSKVIAFFQHRRSFDILEESSSKTAVHVVFEMVSMSFEQQNHLWGMLGGKYMPSVMYKAGIIDIQDEQVKAEIPSVETLEINE
ncbi:MAG: DUF4255 domain-containing protein [Candidatus Electrothrix sp. ATG1]|nr:DUF4255 domain-containing protein [Candidatus Electrothrix sp. ATG1]